MLLYDSQASGNCFKVLLLLAQLGVAYDRVEVDTRQHTNREELLGDKNPALRVPVLRLDDGRHLAESNAILWYLADGTPYLSADAFERAQTLQWMFFEQYSHEPYVAVVRHRALTGHLDLPDTEERRAKGYAALDALERHLEEHELMVGDAYSIADIALYAYTHVAAEGGFDLDRYAAIPAWLGRVAAQPGYVPITH